MAKVSTAKATETEETVVETKKNTEELVKIKLPRGSKTDGDVFVSVNERTWLIKRGVEVEVPACVAEVIAHSEDMQNEIDAFMDANAR